MTGAERQKAYRLRHPERVKANRRARYAVEAAAARRRKSNPETWGACVLPNIRHRAKKAGLECTISAVDLKVPAVCPVLGTPIVIGSSTGRQAPNSPSVDRFHNDQGYTPGNVRVISLRANMLKSDATLEEMELILRYMRGEAL